MLKIVGTKKSKHLEEGKVYSVSQETANILIQKGFATKEGDEPKEKKKTTKKSAKK